MSFSDGTVLCRCTGGWGGVVGGGGGWGGGVFFFNDTATTEIYTLSLHDALPIWVPVGARIPTTVNGSSLCSANDTD